ncbi:hypothetical protein EII20_03065 [Comamonadaceae bacterium OH2545_COT-014]|nr:hypothetical protein EII20_03065 [Comamonadaceae bacterium OH2545_COT-014]
MTQRTPATRPAAAPQHVNRHVPSSALPPAAAYIPAQARGDFDAALRRARTPREAVPHTDNERDARAPREAEERSALSDQLPPVAPLAAWNPGHGASAPLAAEGAQPAATPQTPAQHPHAAMAQSVATQASASQALARDAATAQQANAAARQWQLNLPVAGAANPALGVRLTQSQAGHWQLRLQADAALRQQLEPHVDRLRHQLRQQRGQQFSDLGFEDEA